MKGGLGELVANVFQQWMGSGFADDPFSISNSTGINGVSESLSSSSTSGVEALSSGFSSVSATRRSSATRRVGVHRYNIGRYNHPTAFHSGAHSRKETLAESHHSAPKADQTKEPKAPWILASNPLGGKQMVFFLTLDF